MDFLPAAFRRLGGRSWRRLTKNHCEERSQLSIEYDASGRRKGGMSCACGYWADGRNKKAPGDAGAF
jgi:hypothetical protein